MVKDPVYTTFNGFKRKELRDMPTSSAVIARKGILTTKKHYTVLDGLRGIAAFAIVVFHFMEWIFPDSTRNFIGHGFLAVDFFFCLSGFVIGYAYDDRISTIGQKEFFKSRLIRLQPLVILGSVLGLIAFLFDPFAHYASQYSVSKLIKLFLASVFLIPYPVIEERAFNLFSLNAPAWSLFWEYVANIAYAIILFRIGRYSLVVLLVFSACILGYVSYSAGNLLGGWSADTFWHGGARILYSFVAGLIIFRFQWILKNKLGFLGLGIMLSLAFFMPFFGWNWLAELMIVTLYFPLIVSLGAGATVSPRLHSFCKFSGNISYPLYMTHYFVIWIFGGYYTLYHPDRVTLTLIVVAGALLLVGFAYLVMVFYDIPLRNYLQKRRITNLREDKR